MKRNYKLSQHYECNGKPTSLVTNGFGSYYCIDDELSYQGWYVLSPKDWKMQKLLESITLLSEGECTELTHQLYGLRRKFSSGSEDVVMMYQKVLLYQAFNIHGKALFTFDHRESYGGNEVGRIYAIDIQNDFILLTFRKYDGENLVDEQFIGIRGVSDIEVIDSWREKTYEFDKRRGSRSKLWVYDAFSCIPNMRTVISYGTSAYEARTLCDIAYFHFDDIITNLHMQSSQNLVSYGFSDERIEAATQLASYSLQSLHQRFFFDHRHITGIYAGLPWFFQLWSRDELISLNGLLQLSVTSNRRSESGSVSLEQIKAILQRHVKSILSNGMLANRYPHSELGSIDAIGWLAKRTLDFLYELKDSKQLYTVFSLDDFVEWFNQFEKALLYAKKDHYSNGLFSNKACETWMDTSFNDDGRVGYRIEIQALHFMLYEVIIALGKLTDSSKTESYIAEQDQFKKRVNEIFSKDYIIDGLDSNLTADYAIRSNLFLAYYLAPQLFSQKTWVDSFDIYLEKLFTSWGGITTLSSDNSLFQEEYTGETNASYHRGDVWYFVNHFAAISMLRLDSKKYKSYVDKIVEATCTDILELGLAGHCSELSSAKEQRAQACLAQAWSVATFVELANELQKK